MQVQYDALYQNILTCPKKYPHVIVFDSSPMIGSPSSGSSPARYGHHIGPQQIQPTCCDQNF